MSARPAVFPGSDVFGLGLLDESRKDWRRFLGWGLVLAVVGLTAVGLAFAAGPDAGWAFGVLLLIGGAVQVVTAVRAWEWGGLQPRALTGAVYLVLGGVIAGLSDAALWFTLVAAAGLVVGGAVRAGGAARERFPGWGWVLLSGLVAVVLGAVMGREWPDVGLWAVGLFAGIDLAAGGLTWVMFALALRSTPRPE